MQVPEGWKVKKLEELCSKDAPITYGVLKPGEYFFKGIPLLQIKDLQEGVVLANDLHLISPALDEEYKRSRISRNDILISLVGTIGRVAKYNRVTPANIHRNIGRIRTSLHDYIYYFLTSNLAQNKIKGVSSGSSQSALNLSTLRSLDVLLPPLYEQQKIAKILSTWDKSITITEQLLINSQQQKKVLMQQLLTGKQRLLDSNGKIFREEWKPNKLDKVIAEIKKDKVENPGGSELLTVRLHYNGVARSGKFPNSTERGRPYFKRYEGELIIGRQNLHNGGVAIVSKDCDGLVASNAISSFTNRDNADIEFILKVMSTSRFRFLVASLAGGTGQKETSVKDLLKIKIKVPCLEEQQKIATVLTAADQEITQLEQKLYQLKQEKNALMQQLLTGKRRVIISKECI